MCVFFYGKRKNITVNLGMFASHLSNQKSSARRFNLGARSLFLWLVFLGRHGVIASASYRFFSFPKGSLVFRFSSWMIISPSWEQSIDFMMKDCPVRRYHKSLFKNELSVQFWNDIDQDYEENPSWMGLLGVQLQRNTLLSLGKF